jgi:hypothetical protein
MFEGNIRFQFDLCSWGKYFAKSSPPDENDEDVNSNDQETVSIERMFATTSCIYSDQSTADPNLSLSPPGPFCHQCNIRESSATGIINNDHSGGRSQNKTKKDAIIGTFLIIIAIIISSSFPLISF